MGYSVATPIRSLKARDEMLAFMKENFRLWSTLMLDPDRGDYVSEPNTDLSYDDGKIRIGFDYSTPFGDEREYPFALCRFMALRVGRRRKWKELSKSCPYIVYDGYESWPVLERSEWKRRSLGKWEWCVTDPTGYRLHNPLLSCTLEGMEVIENELLRLAKIWDSR